MLNSLTSIVLSNGINRDEEIIRADPLENPFSLVAIENLGHRDARKTAEVSKVFMGKVHLLERKTVTTRIDLAEPFANPGEKLEQPQVSRSDPIELKDLLKILNLLEKEGLNLFRLWRKLLNNNQRDALNFNRLQSRVCSGDPITWTPDTKNKGVAIFLKNRGAQITIENPPTQRFRQNIPGLEREA